MHGNYVALIHESKRLVVRHEGYEDAQWSGWETMFKMDDALL
jgi:hypothetical protein